LPAATNLDGTRNQRETQPQNENEHTMSTTTNQKTSILAAVATTWRPRRRLIVLALLLGAILLALSMPIAHAAPDPGPGSSDPGPQPLHVHASENPALFAPFETTKTITLTWNPQPAGVSLYVEDNNGYYLSETVDKGSNSFDLTVTFGKTYKVWAIVLVGGDGPKPHDFLIITTEKAEPLVPPLRPIPIPLPQPPGMRT
jgi:hypothetical protein